MCVAGVDDFCHIDRGDNGQFDATNYGFRVFVDDSASHTGRWDMITGTGTSPRYSYFTATRMPTVCNVPHEGTYWILGSADTNSSISEYNEGDNMTHSATTINDRVVLT
jgi:hypothetical protein